MAVNTKAKNDTRLQSLNEIANQSFDQEFQVNVTEPLGYDGRSLQRTNADNLAYKITVDGSITYIATAAPGTDQASDKWKCMKIDETSGVIITYADGDAGFNNVATDLTALIYS